jgi:hypothetical protein
VSHAQRNLEWIYFKNTPGLLLARTLPGHVLYNLAAAVHFARLGLLGTFLRAKLAAAAGAVRVLGQRRIVQRTRRVGASAIWQQLEPRWLSMKLQEKAFDTDLAEGVR